MFAEGNALTFDLRTPEDPPATHNIDEYRPAVLDYIVALFRLMSDECKLLFTLSDSRIARHADLPH